MKRTLAALALLLCLPLSARAQHARQRAIPHYLAQYSGCGALNEDDLFVIVDASSRVDCDSTPEEEPSSRVAAYCVCDGGVARPVGIDAISAATTTTAGVVELATDGETAANVVVQGNDARLAAAAAIVPSLRTVHVQPFGVTEIVGKLYGSVKSAADYVATQSPAETTRWVIVVQGGTAYTEEPFTIPAWTDLRCDWGGDIYTGGFASTSSAQAGTITGTVLSGAFVTMATHSSIRNCNVYAAGNSTAPRTTLLISGASASLDHVGVGSDELGASTEANIVIDIDAGGSSQNANLYYVVATIIGDNANAIGIRAGSNTGLRLSNGIVSTSGAAGAKGIQSLANTPKYGWLHNVSIGAPYGGTTWTLDISEEGTGAFYVTDTEYQTSSGTITRTGRSAQTRAYATLPTCDAQTLGMLAIDTSNSNELCGCSGAGPAWAATDGAGTCD